MRHNNFKQKEFYSSKHDKPHRLSYLEWGDEANDNILICVHGLTRNSRDFDYVAAELCSDYRVITLDVVGRGKSEWVDPSLYNYDTYVKDIFALYEHLKIKKANWLGTSMGGLIAMMFSATTPGVIKKLCLNDIGPFVPKDCLARIAKYVGTNPKFSDLSHAETEIKIILAQFGIKHPDNWRYITMNSTQLDNNGDLRLAYDPKVGEAFKGKSPEDITDIDLHELWNQVNFSECLVVRGSKSDVLLPETLNYMLKTKENISVIQFENVGHAPALMEEDQVKAIVDWFRS